MRESVYQSLVVQTRLRPYLDAVNLVIDDNGISFDSASVGALLESKRGTDERNALIDLVELNRYTTATLRAVSFDGIAQLRSWIDALPGSSPLRAELTSLDVLNASASTGTARRDIFLGDANANSFSAGDGDDLVDGGAGNDTMYGGVGDDVLTGGAGNDTLYGDGDGVYGSASGNDVLDGGAGNDVLRGSFGSDTYLFGRGDGQDTLYNATNVFGSTDPLSGKQDVLQFKAGVAASDVTLTRSGEDLVARINGTTDQVAISYYFSGDGVTSGGNAVEKIRFADGTTWDLAQVKAAVLQSTAGNDAITGYATDDILGGAGGNDTLYGRGGNDSLSGGDGDD